MLANAGRIYRPWLQLSLAVLLLSLSGCTAFYARSFSVVPEEQLSTLEKKALYAKTRDFLISQGYSPRQSTLRPGVEGVTFQIRDARSRLFPAHRISDYITLSVTDAGDIEIGLNRLSHYPPDDFSDRYVADFVSITQKFIRESSGKNVKLVTIGGN